MAPNSCNQCFANAGSNVTVCGLNATVTATQLASDMNTHWIPQAGITYGTINDPSTTVTAAAPGTYNLVWQVTNSSSLTCTDTMQVTFNAIPTSTFNVNSASICSAQTSTITYTGTGGTQFNYNFGAGTPATAVSVGPHTVTYTNTGTAPVVYVNSLWVTASNGCTSDTTYQPITVNPIPSSAFSATGPVCVNDPSYITYTGGSTPPLTYTWNSIPAPATSTPSFPSNQPGPFTLTWSAVGTPTITLFVTSAAGCISTTTTQQVQVLSSATPNCCLTPSPNAGPDASVCSFTTSLAGSIPAAGNIASWTQVSGPVGGTSTFVSNSSFNTLVTVTAAGTYTYAWHEVSGACDATDNVVIIFTEQPRANAGEKDQICGLDFVMEGVPSVLGATGSWSTAGGLSTTFTPVTSPNANAHANSGYGTYFLIWTETNGACVSADTVRIDFLLIPSVNAGTDVTSCGQVCNLSADSIYPGYWTATHNGTAFYPIFTDNNADPSPHVWIPSYTPTTYPVVFTWHAFNGICAGNDAVTITFIKPPLAVIDQQMIQSVCGTQTQLLADTIGSGIVNAWWTCDVPGLLITPIGLDPVPWHADANATSLGANFFNSNSQHQVNFIWNAQNGATCVSADTLLVTFYQKPISDAGIDASICGLNYDLTGAWSILAHDGIWSTQTNSVPPPPGTANFIPTTSPTAEVTVTSFGIYNFIWKEMNQGMPSCLDRDTVRIEFKVTPMPDAGLDTSVCGLFARICATPSVSGGQWSCPGGGVAYYDAPINQISHNVPSYKDSICTWIRFGSPNHLVTMYWFENNGFCTGYDSVNVYFGSIQPAVSLVGPTDTTVCGPVFSLLAGQQPDYGYGYWMDTVQNTTYTPSPINNTPIATIDTGGVGYYGWHNFYWITVNGICRDTSVVVPVKFIEQPVANAGPHYWPGLFGNNRQIKTDTVCGLNYEMAAVPSIGNGHWYSLDPANVHFGTSTGPQQTTNPYDSLYCVGNYTVFNPIKYREFIWQEDHEDCVDSDTLRLYFAPHPSGTFTTTMPQCRHDSSRIVATTWPLPNNVDYMLTGFEWTYAGGQLSPVIINPNVSDTIYVSWPTGEQHSVSLITTNTWGCRSGILTHQVIEPAPFNPSYDLVDAHCMGCNGTVELSTANGPQSNYYTFAWLSGQNFLDTTSVTQSGLCPLTSYGVVVNGQSLSLDATPGTICHDTLSIFVSDTGKVTANFDTLLLEQHQAAPYGVQFINTSVGGRKYSWRIYDEAGTLVYTSTLEAPLYTFEDEGCYKIILVATSKLPEWGCKDTMEFNPLCVDAYPLLEVPNSFTPNNDGKNDLFRVNSKSIIEFHAVILNRWGKKLYEWDNADGYWDGKIGGSDASPGVYYYIVTAKGKKETDYEFKGFFYLLREK
jgi:gliding motility-associated-like protein